MNVNKIYLDGFRNYNGVTIQFCENINVITGSNAQGKTNLIEAVFYLTTGRSFRTASDRELISFDRDNACIRADITSGKRDQTIEARIYHGRRREFLVNGVKLKKVSELEHKTWGLNLISGAIEAANAGKKPQGAKFTLTLNKI